MDGLAPFMCANYPYDGRGVGEFNRVLE
jgi:hypothetical protein